MLKPRRSAFLHSLSDLIALHLLLLTVEQY